MDGSALGEELHTCDRSCKVAFGGGRRREVGCCWRSVRLGAGGETGVGMEVGGVSNDYGYCRIIVVDVGLSVQEFRFQISDFRRGGRYWVWGG